MWTERDQRRARGSHFGSARPVGGRWQNKQRCGSCYLPSEYWVWGRSDGSSLNWGWHAGRRPADHSGTTNQKVRVSSSYCSLMLFVFAHCGRNWRWSCGREPRSPDHSCSDSAPQRWRTNWLHLEKHEFIHELVEQRESVDLINIQQINVANNKWIRGEINEQEYIWR